MMCRTLLGALLCLLAAPACGRPGVQAETEPKPFTDESFAKNPYWFDGTAELNFYEATIAFYGQPRGAEQVVHVVVTEDHDPKELVKADDWRRPGLLKVLKFNELRHVKTGVYEYRQMLSVFFDHYNRTVAKLTLASQDWCGSSFKEIVNHRGLGKFEYHTYWEGRGDGNFALDYRPGLVPYDSLPVQLRMLRWRIGLEAEVPILSTQYSSKASPPEVGNGTIRVESREALEVPAGSFSAYRVSVAAAGGQDLFWFEAEFPHRLLRWQTASGDRFALAASKKLAYWELHDLGDDAHLR